MLWNPIFIVSVCLKATMINGKTQCDVIYGGEFQGTDQFFLRFKAKQRTTNAYFFILASNVLGV